MAEQNLDSSGNQPTGFKRELNEIRDLVEQNISRLQCSIDFLKSTLLNQLNTIEKDFDKEQEETEEDVECLKKVSAILETNFTANRLKGVLDESLVLFESKKEHIKARRKIRKKATCVWNWELEKSVANICSVKVETIIKRKSEVYILANPEEYIDLSKPVSLLHQQPPRSTGNKGNGPGELNFPRNIAVNSAGITYVTDSNNDRVCAFSPNLGFLFHFGDKLMFGKMSYPMGIAISKESIFVSNTGSHSISSYNFNGEFIKRVGTRGFKICELDRPQGLAYDETAELLYVCDKGNNRIQVFNKNLEFKKEILRNEIKSPLEIRARVDTLVVLDEGPNCLHYLNKPEYELTRSIITRGTEGQVMNPICFEISQEGLIFISDPGNNCIAIFDQEGQGLNTVGKYGQIELVHPTGLAWSDKKHLLGLCWREKQQLIELFC